MTGVAAAGADCAIDPDSCLSSSISQAAGTMLGCIPVYGGAASIAYNCLYGGGTALSEYYLCDDPFSASGMPVVVHESYLANNPFQVAAVPLPDNPFEAQAELWATAAEFYTAVYGLSEWTFMDPEEWPIAEDFFNLLHTSASESSEEGTGISVAERLVLLELPTPSNITAQMAEMTVDRIDQMNRGLLTDEELDLDAITFAILNLVDALMEIEDRGWETTWSGIIDTLEELAAEQDAAFEGGSSSNNSNSEEDVLEVVASSHGPYRLQPNLYFRVTNLSSMFEQRGRLSASGEFDGLFLSPNTFYRVEYAHPDTNRYAITFFRSGGPGTTIRIPRSVLISDDSGDTDGDGLPDVSESVIGTSVDDPDTDDDGVPDGAELRDGTNPLDGLPLAAGILASVDTVGNAVDIAVIGDLVALSNSLDGVALIDVSNIFEPVVINQISIGTAVKLVGGSFNRLVAVGVDNNLRILNISNPQESFVERVIDSGFTNVNKVEALGRYVYVAYSSFRVRKFDMITGEMIWEWSDADAAVQDISISRGNVYALTGTSLKIFPDSNDTPETLGSVPVAGVQAPLEAGRKLFVGGDYAYVGYFTGYSVIDVSDPTDPVIVGEPPATQLAIHDLVLDGNGRMIATTSFAGTSTLKATVYDSSDPTVVDVALVDFETPGTPRSVLLHRGVALVTDGSEGLQIINYVGADTGDVAPEISFAGGTGFDLSMSEAEAGQLTWLGVDATDDVQIRSVDLLINGQRVSLDTSYPYEVNFRIPWISDTQSSFTIQAVAVDTGGNATSTEVFEINIVDTLPPKAVHAVPTLGDPHFGGEILEIRVLFDDQIDPGTLTGNTFVVVEAGEDGEFDTGDDVSVTGDLSFDPSTLFATLDLPTALEKGEYRISVLEPISDFSGNILEGPIHFTFDIWDENRWIAEAQSGSWSTGSNWSEGLVRIQDRLIIDVPGVDAVTTIANQNYDIHQLYSEERFVLQGRTLSISDEAILNGRFEWKNQTTITGPGMTYANAGMEISGSSNKWVRGNHTFVNNGVLDWVESSIGVYDESVFLNSETGTIELLNDVVASTVHSNDAPSQFVNDGTIIKKGGALFQFQSTRLVNNGTIDIESGEFSFQGARHDGEGQYIVRDGAVMQFVYPNGVRTDIDGPVTLHEGGLIKLAFGWAEFGVNSSVVGEGDVLVRRNESGLNGPSLLEVFGEYDVGSTRIEDSSIANFHFLARSGHTELIDGSTLGGEGVFEATSDLEWNGGNMDGGGVTRVYGTLEITGVARPIVTDRNIEIYGDAICNPGQQMWYNAGGEQAANVTVMEGATWTQIDDFNAIRRGNTSNSLFLNKGTFIKQGDLVSNIPLPFENSGLVRIDGGSLQYDVNYVQKDGETRLSGTNLGRKALSAEPEFEGGLVTGSGAINLGVADVLNIGAIFSPGNEESAGVISIDGGFDQSSGGTIAIDIFGTAQTEGNWDQLVVDRFFTLDGTLEVRLADGFIPAVGESYLILDGENTRVGEFASVSGLDIAADRKFEVVYSDHDVTLTVVAVP